MSKKRAIALAAVLLLSVTAETSIAKSTENKALGSRDRFGAYDDNFVLAHQMQNNDWAADDEKALRARYSFAYTLRGRAKYDIFIAYTGEFDFYWLGTNTRPSGPVINRLSNPGVHVRFLDTDKHTEIGIEHESNGQTIETTNPRGIETAQRAYDSHNRAYFDQISRGSNFLSAAIETTEGAYRIPASIRATARIYFNQDNEVTWGPLAHRHLQLSDYHRFDLRVGKRFGRLGEIEFKWTLGDKLLDTDSFELAWQADASDDNVFSIPVYVRLHHGPLNTLSNYTQRQDSIGIGLRFATF